MPMPKPNPGESKDDFIKRFMGNPKMIEEYPDEKQRMAVAEKQALMKDKKTFSLDNVEIFEAGKWNGDNYSTNDLDQIVEAFVETKSALKPHMKLGHNSSQVLLQNDGYPSAGWITELKRQGNKLLAKIENIPEKIYGLIQNKAYGRISSEIYWNLKLNGKKYKRALKAIALLGADTPEVHSLDDFINLYTENFDGELKIYDKKDEDDMTEKIDQVETQLKEYQKELSEVKRQNEDILKENAELKAYAAQVEYDKKHSEIKTYLESKVKEGKILPNQVKFFTALALDDKELKTYTAEDNHKIEGTGFDMVKGIIENSAKQVDFSEGTQHKQVEKAPEKSKDDQLFDKVNQYAKENNISYNEAFEIVAIQEVN